MSHFECFSHADVAEVLEVHVHVVGHVGVGGLLSAGVVPSANANIFLSMTPDEEK